MLLKYRAETIKRFNSETEPIKTVSRSRIGKKRQGREEPYQVICGYITRRERDVEGVGGWKKTFEL